MYRDKINSEKFAVSTGKTRRLFLLTIVVVVVVIYLLTIQLCNISRTNGTK